MKITKDRHLRHHRGVALKTRVAVTLTFDAVEVGQAFTSVNQLDYIKVHPRDGVLNAMDLGNFLMSQFGAEDEIRFIYQIDNIKLTYVK